VKNMATASLALMLAGGLVITACSGSSGDSQSGDPAQLRIDEIGEGTRLPKDDVIKKELDKALGINLQLNAAAGAGEYYTQLSTALAAGDAPDLFQVDRSHLVQFVKQGLVLDLTDYLDKDLADYKRVQDPKTFKTATVDDHLYALPKRPSGYNKTTYWIRKDWLDRLHLSVPKNVGDFLAVAKAFTQQDPDGNGKKDTFGLTGAATGDPDNNTAWGPLWPAFGSGGPGSFYVKDGSLVNGFSDPATRSALEYVRGLVTAGVMDPDYATNQNLQDHERAMQGKAGIIAIDWPKMTKPQFVAQYKKVQPNAKWVQLAPLAGPGGAGAARHDPYYTPAYAIPATLKGNDAKLAKIFSLMNHVSIESGTRLVSYGQEGVHYTRSGDKVTMTKQGKAESEPFWLYQFSGRDEVQYTETKFSDAKNQFHFALNQPKFEVFDSLITPPDGYNAADATRYAGEQIAQFVGGKKSLDGYDAFLDTLNNQFGYKTYADAGVEQLKSLRVAS